jgi:hypothetical protein
VADYFPHRCAESLEPPGFLERNLSFLPTSYRALLAVVFLRRRVDRLDVFAYG